MVLQAQSAVGLDLHVNKRAKHLWCWGPDKIQVDKSVLNGQGLACLQRAMQCPVAMREMAQGTGQHKPLRRTWPTASCFCGLQDLHHHWLIFFARSGACWCWRHTLGFWHRHSSYWFW